MEIIKFKKIGVGKYKVVFENTELILYEDVIVKYNLISKRSIKLDILDKVLQDNKYYEMYNLVLKMISTKLRSEQEIERYLISKNCDGKTINKIIVQLKHNDFLNDEKYVNAYLNDALVLKNVGPNKIKQELLDKGIEESLIDKCISFIEEDIWVNKIDKYISKAINNKKYSSNMLKHKIQNDLYFKGFNKDLIYLRLENIVIDETKNLQEEYNKIYKKYKNKYSDEILNSKIISYLSSKGYNYSDIKKYINE